MLNIYEEIDRDAEDFDEQEHRENYLNYFKTNFEFLLCPTLFARHQDLPRLNWTRVKYSDHATHAFPSQQGVYMFMVSFENINIPVNSYVMYVGKAGDVNSDNTIAIRFRDYVNPSGYASRTRIKRMIKWFSDHLIYYYATIPNGQSTSEVEETLADIFVPPCCQRDFTANVRTLLRGVRL